MVVGNSCRRVRLHTSSRISKPGDSSRDQTVTSDPNPAGLYVDHVSVSSISPPCRLALPRTEFQTARAGRLLGDEPGSLDSFVALPLLFPALSHTLSRALHSGSATLTTLLFTSGSKMPSMAPDFSTFPFKSEYSDATVALILFRKYVGVEFDAWTIESGNRLWWTAYTVERYVHD